MNDEVPSAAITEHLPRKGWIGRDGSVVDAEEPRTTGDAEPGIREELITLDDEAHSGHDWVGIIGWAIAVACAIGVFFTLDATHILSDTTPTGGDMGAHVWAPAFLRDHLLANFRLTGWTSAWYAGFPAFTFYMVVPSLLIVWLDIGLTPWLGIPLAAAVVAGAAALQARLRTRLARVVLWSAAVVLAVALIDIPYNVAFKLVAVSGLVTLPLAAYTLGRCARLAFPGPPLLAIGATLFLFEGGYSILGGNILSTMAGEFAFSISLTLSLLYLAVLFKGVETGRHRALGAVLLALVVLNHLIPAIFAVVATLVVVLTRREDRVPWWDRDRTLRYVAAGAVVLVLVVVVVVPAGLPVVGTCVALAMLAGFDRRALRWAAVVVPVGGLLAAWWVVPFYLNSAFLNDMGWEKYTEYAAYLWPEHPQFDMAHRNVWFALAAAGMVLSLVHRVRLGWFLTLTFVAFGWAFVFLPQYRLWNARLLPFYYLCLYLLAGLAIALVVRSLAIVAGDLMRAREEPAWLDVGGALVAGGVALVFLMGSSGGLPGTQPVTITRSDGSTIGGWKAWGMTFRQSNAGGWARYNFSGLEDPGKAFPEYSAMIDMMEEVGAEHGCGRAMWEYESNLDRFGTPMAPMLLPYFTDGCIGSMEGLYFEASSTTPFHFINQSELSPKPSRAQRDLPYPEFDLDAGIRHLQLMGVKYYLASTPEAVAAARQNPELTELASTDQFTISDKASQQPATRQWVAFEVADADPVVPLQNLPVVITPEDDHIDGWVYDEERPEGVPGQPGTAAKTPGPAIEWYLDPTRWDVPLATSGPDDWPRIAREEAGEAPAEPVPAEVEVSDVEQGEDWISFEVSQPGTPVLVRTSYFPNWKASGADGPWRVSPNFMVVVPTQNEVRLSYGRSTVEWLGLLLTFAGVAVAVVLARADERRREAAAVLFAEVSEASGDGAGPGGPDQGVGPGRSPAEPQSSPPREPPTP
jgi:hypothetical protein